MENWFHGNLTAIEYEVIETEPIEIGTQFQMITHSGIPCMSIRQSMKQRTANIKNKTPLRKKRDVLKTWYRVWWIIKIFVFIGEVAGLCADNDDDDQTTSMPWLLACVCVSPLALSRAGKSPNEFTCTAVSVWVRIVHEYTYTQRETYFRIRILCAFSGVPCRYS